MRRLEARRVALTVADDLQGGSVGAVPRSDGAEFVDIVGTGTPVGVSVVRDQHTWLPDAHLVEVEAAECGVLRNAVGSRLHEVRRC